MLFDTHSHLDQPEFDADRAEVLVRARDAGLQGMLCVGITAASSQAAVRLAEQHADIWAAVGIHPNYAAEATEADWQAVVDLAAHPRVVALGETGLDRHWDFTPFDVQQTWFARHLQLAEQRNLPFVVHCREADAEVMSMLGAAAGRGPLRGILHAFSGDAAMAAQCIELGLHVSFAGNVTYTNKKFQTLREAARTVPLDRLLIETDCPYLTPHPLRGKQRRNEPSLITNTAASLAELLQMPSQQLAEQTTTNARRLFALH